MFILIDGGEETIDAQKKIRAKKPGFCQTLVSLPEWLSEFLSYTLSEKLEGGARAHRIKPSSALGRVVIFHLAH